MNVRQEKIFTTLVKEYIKTAEPIGSNTLQEISKLTFSSATIRNDMALLEKQGYLISPHTSAGRIPTQKGYQLYIEKFLKTKKIPANTAASIQNKIIENSENDLKALAKQLSHISNLLVFLAFSQNNVYYTGLFNLFSQPEFSNQELIYDITKIVDHFDEVINDIFEQIENDIHILVGDENPFSQECSTIICNYTFKNNQGVMGILGPMRMNYEQNFALINFARQTINS